MFDFRNKTVDQLKDLLSYHTKHSSMSDYLARKEYEDAAAELNSRGVGRQAVPPNLTEAQIARDRQLAEWGRQARDESAVIESLTARGDDNAL